MRSRLHIGPKGLLVLAASFLLVVPATALAAEDGARERMFETVLTLLIVVSAAYLVSHLATEWISDRFGIVTGAEYIVLGAIVGPGLGVFDETTLAQFSPALVLGTGSLGLLTGLQLNFRTSEAVSGGAFGIGAVVSLATLGVVAGIPLAGITYLDSWLALQKYLPHLLCLGAVALVADLGPLRSLIAFLDARGPGAELALRVARACSSLAIIVFGIIFCLYKSVDEVFAGFIDHSFTLPESFGIWFGIHIALGIILGLIFTAFLIRDFEDEKILTVVIGMVIFTCGLAYYLKLSPIFVCFILGVVLANLCRQSGHVESMLLSVERPLYIVLFFFAGAELVFEVEWWAYVGFLGFLLLRWFGRLSGGHVAARVTRAGRSFPPMGSALWAPGALAVAMVLDFREVYGGLAYARELYVILIMSILASEAIAYRSTRKWLIDATDVAFDKGTNRLQEIEREDSA